MALDAEENLLCELEQRVHAIAAEIAKDKYD